MFFFHPSKRWSFACSSAPFWVCCVWRQCSASELSEVKGGHKGRQGARPCGPAGGLPSPPTSANRPHRSEEGAATPAGQAGHPLPAAPGQSRTRPSRPGGEREEDVTLMSARGDAAALCTRGREGGGGLLRSSNLHLYFIFLNTLSAIDPPPWATTAGRGTVPPHRPNPACVRPSSGSVPLLSPPFASALQADAASRRCIFRWCWRCCSTTPRKPPSLCLAGLPRRGRGGGGGRRAGRLRRRGLWGRADPRPDPLPAVAAAYAPVGETPPLASATLLAPCGDLPAHEGPVVLRAPEGSQKREKELIKKKKK